MNTVFIWRNASTVTRYDRAKKDNKKSQISPDCQRGKASLLTAVSKWQQMVDKFGRKKIKNKIY